MKITWNNKMKSRGRKPCAIIVGADGSVAEFRTSGVLGQYAVHEVDHEKCGKWSNTTYEIELGDGVRFYWWTPDFDTGKSFPDCQTWEDIYREVFRLVGLPLDKSSLVACLRVMKSGLAERVDSTEEILASLSRNDDDDVEIITVNFGGPTNRQISGGYWTRDEIEFDGVSLRKTCDYWQSATIETVQVVEPEGAKVLSVDHQRGHHGGYISIKVALPQKEEE